MEFHDLEVFVAVTQEKSFSRAALRIFRTQPAVSLAVRRLEEELGGSLFDRSTKEPVLTDLGRLVFQYALELLNIRKKIKPAIEELRSLKKGKVRIGANEIGAVFLLPHVIAYRKHFPDIRLEVVRLPSSKIPGEIVNRNLDVGIISYDPKDANLVSTVVYEDQLALVVYPSHRFAKMKKVSLEDLGHESFAAHYVKSSFRDQLVSMFDRQKVPLNIDLELPTIEAIKKFVMMEQALALVPRMCIQTELDRKELVEVKVAELSNLNRKLRVTYLKGKAHSHSARAFVDVLLEYAKERAAQAKKS